jgi:hypothetical protein
VNVALKNEHAGTGLLGASSNSNAGTPADETHLIYLYRTGSSDMNLIAIYI